MNNYDNNLTENMFKDFTDEPKPIIMDFENKNLFKPAEIKNLKNGIQLKKFLIILCLLKCLKFIKELEL